MKHVTLPSSERVPALGIGTWHMGDVPELRNEELATLRLGIEHGATLLDTAEMYGDGRSEELVGEAIAGVRDQVFIVDKVLPSHASREGTIKACERSLRRLKTERIDLYLLHWPGSVPVSETIDAFMRLQRDGKIRYYGVSNFDLDEMRQLWPAPGGDGVQTNQLLYNLSRRGIEWDLLPFLREHGIPVMAYSPIEQSRLLQDPKLLSFAETNGMSPGQAALSWLLAKKDIIAIPKTSRRERLLENLGALQHPLSGAQLAELDRLFPPPKGPRALEML